ncbi:dihydrolipoyl dehydrogenase family protein [Puniceicoccus vermicola]|uniref:NAD(P)/FAD-dependent oxidoreductase n=1 Tax=Puniceicoccus vermicola TaxID=388746 RepID=A0A7X1E4V2_9BACT|nr:NAD(P)/FAD-dependent oxidoreductase [Puniceicoccus vermicola]MBC2602403.1 NAD(P)/FAD-dependent oxidoreductase [Puniceicoccus vermicola]
MSQDHFDFLVLGGGSAGYNAASLARKHVERVAIVDGSKELGGLCILRGCMPSKTLLYSADVLQLARESRKLGLNISRPQVDMAALHQRKLDMIADFAGHRRSQIESDRYHLFRQNGKLGPDRTVILDDGTQISADRILISTGSHVSVPDVPGLADVPFLTSDDILDLDTVPESVIVLGGGVVACELAQFLCRIGSKVIMIQRSPHILSDFEPDMAAVLEEALIDEGVELFTHTDIENIEPNENGVSVQFRQGHRAVIRQAQFLFNALGRKPATAKLGLEEIGIETRSSGHIRTNEYQMTSHPGIYAAGDCAGPHEIVHIAILQGETAARHSLGLEPMPVDYDKVLSVVFTDPQIASVGPSEETIRENLGDSLQIAEFPFSDHGRSMLMEARRGYVRLFSSSSDRKIHRAECVGRDAGELIHSMAVAVGTGATVDEIMKAPWYHPTLSEIWTYPLEDLAG